MGSVRALVWRETRTATIVMMVLVGAVIEVGLRSYAASGGAAGMLALQPLLTNPAIAALYGRVANLDNAGSFVVWKMGAFLLLAVALWAALAATRMTRASEDGGAWDLLVIGRRERGRVLAETLLVLAISGVVVGVVAGLVMVLGGQGRGASAFYGLGVVASAWSGTAAGALAAQLAAPRRASTQVAIAFVVAAFFVRVIADAASSTHWLLDATFFGWIEKVGAFQTLDPLAVVPALAGPIVVGVVVGVLQTRRDVGGALYVHADAADARPRGLGSPWLFAWRERASVWKWWTVGLAIFGAILGYLTHALVALARTDPGYVALLRHWGFGAMVTGVGFIAFVSLVMSVAFTFLVVAWIATVASDEVKGRLEVAWSTGPRRSTWLATVVATSLVALTVAVAATVVAMWVGVHVSGTNLSLLTVAHAEVASLALTVFMVGLSVVLVGVVPRAAFALGAVFVIVAYVTQSLGPVLHWPSLLLAADPFHYLRAVPVQAFDWRGFWGVSAAGVALGALGLWRYVRRDAVG